ncbi:ParB N-terminal domain-containing protein [Candidatus Enterovibrio altilux]|uniref:Chromosome (Plasmid) partitioning protein ParB n=1 Tax=Candidatus Enterovibrio altilux TaxID=1927128 RepID=A0A291BAR7_9GAMM|nr:ParB N-terminal domain-containing protein [Candidatus Enterovibrio luxaltus]ATF10083.1 Chromosome (plasmid) partitioning protein ParB [Candidatus Enterovibrio luxaltus]
MVIKTSELNARLFGKADKRRVKTVQEAQKAVSDKATVIALSVAGETTVEFQLIRIPSANIASRTSVFVKNAREQSFLNELALSDILSTLQDRGQQYPAVGRWLDDDKIEVLDGSRRRMSCILASQDFLIYVAKGINSKHATFLSNVANAHKPLSLFERGKEMQTMLNNGDVVDQKELAKVCMCSEALVSGALKAASLPLLILQAYPSVVELGRPTIVKLHRLFFALTDTEQGQLLQKLSETPLWRTVDAHGVSRITREVTIIIEEWHELLNPSVKKNAQAIDLIKGRASYHRKGNTFFLKLKKMNEEDAQVILDFIHSRLA